MKIEIWKPWFRVVFLELGAWEFILLGFYVLLALVLLIRSRRDFQKLIGKPARRRLVLFIGLLAAPLLFNHILVLSPSPPDLLPPPNIPLAAPRLFVPLLGSLPILVAGATLGAGPALLVGLISGILRADTVVSGIAEPLHLALAGYVAGLLLRQDYRGRLMLLARQPLVVALVVTPLAELLLLLAVLAHVGDAGLAGFDYALTLTRASFWPGLVESLAAAAILQALYLLFPLLRPVRVAHRSSPYHRSLNLRLLLVFVPLVLVMTCGLTQIVTETTLRTATLEAVNEMTRNATSAAEEIPYFIHTGQGLLTEFANDERLRQGDRATLQALLESDMHTVVFFDQLMLFGPDGQLLAMHPPAPTGDPDLTTEEKRLLQRVLRDGAPQISSAHPSERGEPHMAFLAPVGSATDSGYSGALLGRTRLDFNPVLTRILTSLQWIQGQGEGFIVNAEGRIVSHSDPNMLLAPWHVEKDCTSIVEVPRGCVYESRDPVQNTRQLVYALRAEGCPWTVVVRVPHEVVLAKAQEVATPLLFLQFLFGGGLMVVIPLVTSVMTRPLQQLAVAADRIAEGNLARPIQVSGEDEVGRVGNAFEGMRVRLKGRMEDLSLLLETSQEVSATLELSAGMPFILEGVLKAAGAQVARIVLLSADGEPQSVMSRGTPSEGVEDLDRSLVAAVKGRRGPLTVENLTRARTLTDPMHSKPIKAAVALPVYTKDRMAAVIWVGYGDIRYFDDQEITLLSMLAHQAAVLVENARLFQAAEGGRRQLSAILDSATDAVIVADWDDRILLVNPAAAQAFGIKADEVAGKKIDKANLIPELVQAFNGSSDEAPIQEIALLDGHTLYVNVSTIRDADGEQLGRVAVMRDVTRFKELDELKSEFLATVSHDLRTPLMFMRGYATMLPTIGELSDKQREYVEKILEGVGQINELVGDLLDLGRIEAGVGFRREPCHLVGVLIEAVDTMRAQAAAKGIALQRESTENNVTITGDAPLLRRAVINLIDNALKYTPSGGSVTVGLSVHADDDDNGKRAVIHVTDTGIGIAPQDQVRLFEKFYRIKRSDTSEVKGTGLGLAIVKSIVERHQGKVWVESEAGKGSTFYISLPLDSSPRPVEESTRIG
jgi:PAS domain S-box-containing protein